MLTQQPIQSSRAHRWAYVCGLSVKRSYHRLKIFEFRLVEHAETAEMPAGKLLIRGSFLTAKLALVGGLLSIGFWLIASVVVMIAVIALLRSKAVIDTDLEEDNPGPDYLGANSYLGNYDDNGHYIGYFKSTDDVR
ncbi:DUF3742 domain-containing protein [Pseudomonas syringae]|uniref:DUF3742 domain-containing protein n=1 Tax=Pseudomonas syringae TaxID=317 RepID=UPI0034D6D148